MMETGNDTPASDLSLFWLSLMTLPDTQCHITQALLQPRAKLSMQGKGEGFGLAEGNITLVRRNLQKHVAEWP
jgi:hypothetical protein